MGGYGIDPQNFVGATRHTRRTGRRAGVTRTDAIRVPVPPTRVSSSPRPLRMQGSNRVTDLA